MRKNGELSSEKAIDLDDSRPRTSKSGIRITRSTRINSTNNKRKETRNDENESSSEEEEESFGIKFKRSKFEEKNDMDYLKILESIVEFQRNQLRPESSLRDFSGSSSENVESWLSDFDNYVRFTTMSEEQKIAILQSRLIGDAREIYDTISLTNRSSINDIKI